MMYSDAEKINRFILEIPDPHIKLIGHLLHMHLLSEGHHPLGEELLDMLIEQTNSVKRNPKEMGVFVETKDVPKTAMLSKSVWHEPYDQFKKKDSPSNADQLGALEWPTYYS
jgi:hypothetical protein